MTCGDERMHALCVEMAKKYTIDPSHLDIRKEHYKCKKKKTTLALRAYVNYVKYMHFMKLFKFHKLFMTYR
jgi:hypothetical protein